MNEAFFFYFFSALVLLAALYVVLTRNPTYAVLSLVAAMFFLAVLFVLLRAYFIAAVHLLVYAGAILVLFLFVVMLLGLGREETWNRTQGMFRLAGGLTELAFLSGLGMIILAASAGQGSAAAPEGTIEAVGKLLFTRYFLPFEVTSILLLVGIIGAVVLARKEEEKAEAGKPQAIGQPQSSQRAGGASVKLGQAAGQCLPGQAADGGRSKQA